MNRFLFLFLFAATLLFTGCCSSHGNWLEYKIFCGLSQSDGAVSEAEWEQFCEDHVTAEFPEGYTTMRATGYWKSDDAQATMREDSRVIVVLASSDAKDKVRRIARQYRRLFHQEAVLIVTTPANTEFVDGVSEEQP